MPILSEAAGSVSTQTTHELRLTVFVSPIFDAIHSHGNRPDEADTGAKNDDRTKRVRVDLLYNARIAWGRRC
jgi:hypothetical protein